MKIKQINIGELKLLEENVRMHPAKQIDEYIRSLKMFGQIKNAVVDEDYNVLVGNGLVLALQKMGVEKVSVLIKDNLSENEKKKLMMSDNKVFSLGVDNLNILDKFINELVGDLDIPGYDEDTLNSMVADAEKIADELMEYGKLDDEKVEEIKNTPEPMKFEESKKEDEAINEKSNIIEKTEPTEATEFNNTDEVADENIKVGVCVKCGEEIWLSKEFLRQLI